MFVNLFKSIVFVRNGKTVDADQAVAFFQPRLFGRRISVYAFNPDFAGSAPVNGLSIFVLLTVNVIGRFPFRNRQPVNAHEIDADVGKQPAVAEFLTGRPADIVSNLTQALTAAGCLVIGKFAQFPANLAHIVTVDGGDARPAGRRRRTGTQKQKRQQKKEKTYHSSLKTVLSHWPII